MVCCCVSNFTSCVTVVSHLISWSIVSFAVTISGSPSVASTGITSLSLFSIASSGWVSSIFMMFCRISGVFSGSSVSPGPWSCYCASRKRFLSWLTSCCPWSSGCCYFICWSWSYSQSSCYWSLSCLWSYRLKIWCGSCVYGSCVYVSSPSTPVSLVLWCMLLGSVMFPFWSPKVKALG